MRRFDRLRRIRSLDPETDYLEIYRLSSAYEFPWDHTRALELALYRTYAVPAIGRLLAETAELTDRSQKRYDDTVLLLGAVLEHGPDSEQGRTAVRRMNRMHRSYPISDEDMRYVLCTFVVLPKRWIGEYGWRRLSEHELRASANYYRRLGELMGISGIPRTHQEFEECMDAYEAAHFGFDEGGRRVSDATLNLMGSWYPAPLRPLLHSATVALLDEPLRRAFGYPEPAPGTVSLAGNALRLRARVVRALPPRRRAHWPRMNREVRSYPGGFRIEGLGTFPPAGTGCPVHPAGPAAAGE
ncbi:oxygenase MpaB family protein [Kitasatospora sp. NPDC006697]|uniref:oxygenase MpaB family protein n=1 Tax=Kitasatospora sp. NPDC006697 TaxID=3364020 RepID=UPI0036AA6515